MENKWQQGATTLTSSGSDFRGAWQTARQRQDVAELAEIALNSYDSSHAVPSWLSREIFEVCESLAVDLSNNIDRRDDSQAGVHLVRLSSLLVSDDQMFAMLGLAYHCIQPSEQDGEVNPRVPALLDSLLSVFDALPRASWPPYAHHWRELAIRRVAHLVSADVARQVSSFQNQYADAISMADGVLWHTVAKQPLDYIESKLPTLRASHSRLQKYEPLLLHPGDRAELIENMRILQVLIDAGLDVLRQERRW